MNSIIVVYWFGGNDVDKKRRIKNEMDHNTAPLAVILHILAASAVVIVIAGVDIATPDKKKPPPVKKRELLEQQDEIEWQTKQDLIFDPFYALTEGRPENSPTFIEATNLDTDDETIVMTD